MLSVSVVLFTLIGVGLTIENIIIIRRIRKGNVFTGVCLSTWKGDPSQVTRGIPSFPKDGEGGTLRQDQGVNPGQIPSRCIFIRP